MRCVVTAGRARLCAHARATDERTGHARAMDERTGRPQETDTPFHVVGLKCGSSKCGSYNTRRIGGALAAWRRVAVRVVVLNLHGRRRWVWAGVTMLPGGSSVAAAGSGSDGGSGGGGGGGSGGGGSGSGSGGSGAPARV